MLQSLRQMLFPPAIEEYRVDFDRENSRALSILLFTGCAISLLLFLLEHFFSVKLSLYVRTTEYMIFFSFSSALRISYRKGINSHGTRSLYVWSYVILAYSLLLCSTDGEEAMTFVYLFFLFLLPLLIHDAFGRILILLLFGTAAFLLVDLFVRNGNSSKMNMAQLFMVVIAAAYLSSRAMRDRLSSMVSNTQAETKAEHDALTGIYNRRGGEEIIRKLVKDEVPGAFMIIDVDDFKHVNDTYGHAAGDETLVSVANVLKATFRESDIVMRMGGDEFIVYAVGMADIRNVESKLDKLVASLHEIILNEEIDEHVTASIGCAVNLGSYPTYESLSAAADKLLYNTKSHGKDGYSCTDKDCA